MMNVRKGLSLLLLFICLVVAVGGNAVDAASQYPAATDTFTYKLNKYGNRPSPQSTTAKQTIYAEDLNDVFGYVLKVQETLGLNPQGEYPTVANRFASQTTEIASQAIQIAITEAGVGTLTLIVASHSLLIASNTLAIASLSLEVASLSSVVGTYQVQIDALASDVAVLEDTQASQTIVISNLLASDVLLLQLVTNLQASDTVHDLSISNLVASDVLLGQSITNLQASDTAHDLSISNVVASTTNLLASVTALAVTDTNLQASDTAHDLSISNLLASDTLLQEQVDALVATDTFLQQQINTGDAKSVQGTAWNTASPTNHQIFFYSASSTSILPLTITSSGSIVLHWSETLGSGTLQFEGFDTGGGGSTVPGDAISLQGTPISNASPTLKQVLEFDGTNWVPADVATPSLPFYHNGVASDLATLASVGSGTYAEFDIQDYPGCATRTFALGGSLLVVRNGSVLGLTEDYVESDNHTILLNYTIASQDFIVLKESGVGNNFYTGGGSTTATATFHDTVTAIWTKTDPASHAVNIQSDVALWNASKFRGVVVATTTPTLNQVMKYNGSMWAPGSGASGSPEDVYFDSVFLRPNDGVATAVALLQVGDDLLILQFLKTTVNGSETAWLNKRIISSKYVGGNLRLNLGFSTPNGTAGDAILLVVKGTVVKHGDIFTGLFTEFTLPCTYVTVASSSSRVLFSTSTLEIDSSLLEPGAYLNISITRGRPPGIESAAEFRLMDLTGVYQ